MLPGHLELVLGTHLGAAPTPFRLSVGIHPEAAEGREGRVDPQERVVALPKSPWSPLWSLIHKIELDGRVAQP